MGKVIKVTNGTDTFDVNEDKLSLAVKDGYRPTERVIVANSKTGETYEVNPDKFGLALQDGFSFQDIVKKKSFSQRAKIWWHSWYLRSPIGRRENDEGFADSQEQSGD